MAAFNPFAPQGPSKAGAPQVQGHQAPNVPMQQTTSLTQQLAPTVFNKAMGSEAAGNMGTAMVEGAKGMWGSMTAPAAASAAAPMAANVGSLAAASAAPVAASVAAPVAGALASAAAPAAGALASAAPAALLAGPFAPLVIGGAMLAANSGK